MFCTLFLDYYFDALDSFEVFKEMFSLAYLFVFCSNLVYLSPPLLVFKLLYLLKTSMQWIQKLYNLMHTKCATVMC